jgi:hypothetical protein
MSSEGPAGSPTDARQDGSAGDAPRPSDDPQSLREGIERTREQLGATVEALAAKADVKAQAQQKVSQLTERLTTKAGQARQQVAGKAAATARRRRGPLAAAGAVGAAVLGWLLINRWRRR